MGSKIKSICVGTVMKHNYLIPAFALTLMLGCAHNPRPESPEQRAERQAQSLQEQQDAQSESRSINYRDQQNAQTSDEGSRSGGEEASENTTVTEEASRQAEAAKAREQADAARAALRSTTNSLTPARSITGSLLR